MATETDTGGRQRMPRGAGKLWGGPVVLGILMILVGVMAISAAAITGLAAIIVIGAALGIAGFVEIIHGLGKGHKAYRPLRLLGGLLSLVVGVLFVLRPMAGLSTLTLLLAAYFFASGLFHSVTSLMDRYPNWGWDLAYGIAALVLGVIVVAGWPISALWVVGTLVGIEILMRGIVLTAVGFEVRRGIRAATPA